MVDRSWSLVNPTGSRRLVYSDRVILSQNFSISNLGLMSSGSLKFGSRESFEDNVQS
jgi:hypothetical protein